MNPPEWPVPGSPGEQPVAAPPVPAPPVPAPPAAAPYPSPAPSAGFAPPAPPLDPPPPPLAVSPLAPGRPGAALFTEQGTAVAAGKATGGSVAAGLVYGLVAGLVGGLAWYLAVVFTERQFVYLAIGVGLLVGTAVAKGTRRASFASMAVAGAVTLATMAVAQYFIDRWAAIQYAKQISSPLRIPLFLSIDRAVDVVHAGLSADPSQGVFWAIAVVLSIVTARKYRP